MATDAAASVDPRTTCHATQGRDRAGLVRPVHPARPARPGPPYERLHVCDDPLVLRRFGHTNRG